MHTRRLDTLRGPPWPRRMTALVQETYPLAEVPAAIRRLLEGQVRGPLVVSVSSPTTQSRDPGSTP